jgi:adenylate kinase
VRDFGFLHLSAGDLLRDEVKRKSELGKKCEQLMKDGKLVPAEVTLSLLSKAMKDANNAKGYLIDGFPRALEQAQAFDKIVRRFHKTQINKRSLSTQKN